MDTRIGQLLVSYSARGIPSYTIDLWHDGLKKHRLIRCNDESIAKRKAQLQIEEWADRWMVVDSRTKERFHRAAGKQQQEERKSQAAEQTAEAQQALEVLSSLLRATLSIDCKLDWESLKDKSPFLEPKPRKPQASKPPTSAPLPREPKPLDSRYLPKLGLLDKIISSRKDRLFLEKKMLFAADHDDWCTEISNSERTHSIALRAHEKMIGEQALAHEEQIEAWAARKNAFLAEQSAASAVIDAQRTAYEAKDAHAISKYCDLVLSMSSYPADFPQEFDLQYDPGAKTLLVDYQLPGPDDLPRLKAVKYIANRDEFEEQFITDVQSAKQYDDVLYQVVLRTVHELFEADTVQVLDAVVVNGIVTAVDRTTGKLVTACILSLRANRSEFMDINLAQVDPKACFKSLKGVGSSKLHGLSAVPPIMPLRRDDARFVSAYEVVGTLDDSVNLAAMHWEDFEHLIREVFEKEFSSNGGEVRVTQASRDGGVDAVAFDPDPIRGGKIVIQAKRYTNTVGVSAVRDLYGTVLNEGATKGILVTTSDYGPDSYAFANGKPLVLLSGANLLHILDKHGHRARIDLREAKKIASEQSQ